MKNFAVLALACNEDNVIERLLKSLPDCEIHISIDKKTTDNTKEIAEKYTQNIYEHEFINNSWADTRNEFIEKVEAVSDKEWLLYLDADEWIEDGLALIDDVIKIADDNKLDSISVTMKDYPNNKIITPSVWMNVKMFKRGIRYKYRRHEVLPKNINRVNAPEIVIGHNKGQRDEVIIANDKLKKDLDALKADYEEYQDKRTALYLADSYQAQGRHEECIELCLKGLEFTVEQAGVDAMLREKCAVSYRLLKEYKKALEITMPKLLLGKEEFGEACFDIGVDYRELGYLDTAEFYFKMAIAAGPQQKLAGVANPEKTQGLAYYAIAVCEANKGKFLEAAAWLGKAKEFGNKPQYDELWNLIIELEAEKKNKELEAAKKNEGEE